MADKQDDLKSKLQKLLSSSKKKVVSGVSRADRFVESHEKPTMYFVLAVIALFTSITRLLPFRDSISLSPESPLFSQLAGYESYRGVMYTAKNFPQVLFADTLPNYPVDGAVTMTGGLIDTVLAAASLILSVMMPLEQAVTVVLYLIGPLSAVFLVLLVYKIGQEVFDRNIGIVAALVFALLPGRILQSSVAGAGTKAPVYTALLATLTLGLIYYARAADRNIFVFEFAKEDLTEWNSLTKNLLSVLVLSVFFVMSQPSFVLVYSALMGLIGVSYALTNSYNKESPESVTSALFIPLAVTSVIVTAVAVFIPAYVTIHVSTIALVTVLIGLLSRMDSISEILEQPSPRIVLVTVVLGLVGAGAIVARYGNIDYLRAVVQPSRESLYFGDIDSIFTFNVSQAILRNFGLLGFISVLGYAIYQPNVLYNSLAERMNVGGIILASFGLVTAVMGIISIGWFTFTALTVALFSSYFVFFLATKAELFSLGSVDIRAYHILAVIALVAMFIPVLIAPVGSSAVAQAQAQDVSEPEWASASQQLSDLGDKPVDPYEMPMDSPDSGVVTWSDRGSETIQSIGEYPSTGLQTDSTQFSSEYLLSQSEDQAFSVEEKYGADTDYVVLDWQSVSMRHQMSPMVDAHPNYSLRQFYTPVYDGQTRRLAFGVNKDPYYKSLATRLYYYHGSRVEQQPVTVTYTSSEIGERNVATTFLPVQMETTQHIRDFRSMQQAQQYVDGTLQQSQGSEGDTQQEQQQQQQEQQQADYDGIRQIGGVGIHPTSTVSALDHHRYVASSEDSVMEDNAFIRYAQTTSQYTQELRFTDLLQEDGQVKVFQQVEGVKIEGSGGPPDNDVQIVIALENEQTGTPLRYVQVAETDENGDFETTLPYASEGVPEEFTVKPTQNYQMISQVNTATQSEDGQLRIQTTYWYSDEVTVTNEQVENGATIQVQLEEMDSEELRKTIEGDGIIQPQQRDGTNDGTSDESNSSGGEDTSGDTTTDDSGGQSGN